MRRIAHACLVLVVVLASASAGAQPPSASRPSQAAETEYSRVIRDALAEIAAGNWTEARTLFERAHAISPNARTLRGLGIAAFELRHYVQAISDLEAALADRRNPLTQEQRREVQTAVTRSRQYVGTISIRAAPADAEIWLNGVRIKNRDVLLDIGDYEFVVRAAGYREAQRKLSVKGGQRTTLPFDLVPVDLSVPADRSARADTGVEGALGASDRDEGSDGVLSSFWFWAAAVAVVAGGTVTAVMLTQDDAPRGEQGIGGTVQVLTVEP